MSTPHLGIGLAVIGRRQHPHIPPDPVQNLAPPEPARSEHPPLQYRATFFDFRPTWECGTLACIRSDSFLLGVADLLFAEDHQYEGRPQLASLFVHVDHRRQGIARTLAQLAIRTVREDPAQWPGLWLHVEPHLTGAMALYTALGFRYANAVIESSGAQAWTLDF
jgi:GNAT superfamily N-acetyltransferase